MQESKVVVFEGVEYPVTLRMWNSMKLFQESEAIMQINRHVVTIFSSQTWLKLLSILDSVNYSFY